MSISTQPLDAEQKQPGVTSFRLVLKNRNFLLLWCAQLISQIVLNAANFGVIVLVDDVTHNSELMAGLAITAFTLPAVPFSAIAGVVVERANKRHVLWMTNVLRMITMLLMFASLLYNHTSLVPLFFLCFITSLISQFFVPAEGAAIPLLVGERELLPALSLFNISLTVAQGIGFLLVGRIVAALFPPFDLPIGTIIYHVLPADMLFIVAAALYAVCAILILCIPSGALEETRLYAQKEEATVALRVALHSLWEDLVAGWRIISADGLLLYAVIQLSIVGILMLLIGELAGAFVSKFLHRSTQDMALVLAPAAVGLILASMLMPRITAYVGKLRLTIGGFVMLGVCFFLLPVLQWLAIHLDPLEGVQAPWLFWLTLLLVFLLGVAMSAVNIPTSTIMQERAPESGRARVLALQAMFYNAGSIPILLFAGAFAQLIGFSQLIVLIGAIMLIFCCWGSWYLKRNDHVDETCGAEENAVVVAQEHL
ncbi:MAG TPA: MFS transporter [Ktedonobacteraceae bacterium]|jgi:MFS family permease